MSEALSKETQASLYRIQKLMREGAARRKAKQERKTGGGSWWMKQAVKHAEQGRDALPPGDRE